MANLMPSPSGVPRDPGARPSGRQPSTARRYQMRRCPPGRGMVKSHDQPQHVILPRRFMNLVTAQPLPPGLLAGAILLAVSACVQPVRLARDDSPVMLGRQTLRAPDPAVPG